jgi:hypothetical protein
MIFGVMQPNSPLTRRHIKLRAVPRRPIPCFPEARDGVGHRSRRRRPIDAEIVRMRRDTAEDIKDRHSLGFGSGARQVETSRNEGMAEREGFLSSVLKSLRVD